MFFGLFINLDLRILLCLQHPCLLLLLTGQKGLTSCGLPSIRLLQCRPFARRMCVTKEALVILYSSQVVYSHFSVTVHYMSPAVSVNKVINLYYPPIFLLKNFCRGWKKIEIYCKHIDGYQHKQEISI